MTEKKKLTQKQIAVIDDLFEGAIEEQAILEKHKVTQRTYNRWLANESFMDEFTRRLHWATLQSQGIIARYAFVAATKLVQLTESENQETARKACLDIISTPLKIIRKDVPMENETPKPFAYEALSPQMCGRLLETMAELEKKDKNFQKNT